MTAKNKDEHSFTRPPRQTHAPARVITNWNCTIDETFPEFNTNE